MWRKQPRNEMKQEENRELEKNLAEFNCEETIIHEKRQFGRVRNSMMRVLRAKYGNDVANRALSRVNKRMQQKYFDGKALTDLYRHSSGLIK